MSAYWSTFDYALADVRVSAFEPMIELNDFYNAGFGWVCRHCEKELGTSLKTVAQQSRFMTEGEAESKHPELTNKALAKWADAAQRTLMCPHCGITEMVEKA